MKLIRAIINTKKIDELRHKLFEIGAPGVTLGDVTGIGKPLGHLRYCEEKGFTPNFIENTVVEVVAEQGRVEEICEAIIEVCRTGEVGDGKIFILPVESVIRIRTGDKDKDALY